MYKVIELEINPDVSGDTGVFEVAWVEYPAIEQELIYFNQQKFYRAPDNVSSKACRAIKENEERGNPASTQVGKVRGQQLCNKDEISLETIKRMKSYLERAATYYTGNYDDNGTIAYDLWGGKPGLEWVDRILKSEEEFAEVGERGGIRESDKAPKSDTPNKNPKGEGTAKGDASTTKGAEVSAKVEEILQNKSDEFNEKYKDKLGYGVNKGMLKSVYQRGVGAFNTSHSPAVKSAEQWALARVNAFLYLVKNGRPENAKYTTDYDLLPSGHPKKDKMAVQDFVYPSASETKDEFISRCIPYVIKEGKTPEQAAGQCYGMWENKEFAPSKVSFDWDGTLSTGRGKKLLENELSRGSIIYIISARSNITDEMIDLANEYTFPATNIYTTGSNQSKIKKIKELGITRHYDNNPNVINDLGGVGIDFDYDVAGLPDYVDYGSTGDTENMLTEAVLPPVLFSCGCGDMSEMEINVLGYKTKNFHMCPGAISTFEHLIEMKPDEETAGMIRSAAQIADNVFKIEMDVIDGESASVEQLMEAQLLVDDFKDLMQEIDKELGMEHDVSYMDNHIAKITSYLSDEYTKEEFKSLELLKFLAETDYQKFESVMGSLRGATESEIMQRNHDKPVFYFQYDRVMSGFPDRDFCMSIEYRYFRRFEIDLLQDTNKEFGHNGQGYSKWEYKGGPQCVHGWRRFIFTPEEKNKKAQLKDLGMVSGKPGTPPQAMPGAGYFPGTARYEANLSSQVVSYMDNIECVFGDVCKPKFDKTQDITFAAKDEERMIYTPLMIPDILIPRMDEVTNEKYYVKFKPEVIKNIRDKFMAELRNRKTNYEHTDKKFEDIVMVETWIVQGEKDKAYELGFTEEQIPFGTWMGAYKVLDTPEGNFVWDKYIKPGKVRGASVEGNFILNFSHIKGDEYLLEQVINILKQITD
jgi:hypothetical protein